MTLPGKREAVGAQEVLVVLDVALPRLRGGPVVYPCYH